MTWCLCVQVCRCPCECVRAINNNDDTLYSPHSTTPTPTPTHPTRLYILTTNTRDFLKFFCGKLNDTFSRRSSRVCRRGCRCRRRGLRLISAKYDDAMPRIGYRRRRIMNVERGPTFIPHSLIDNDRSRINMVLLLDSVDWTDE